MLIFFSNKTDCAQMRCIGNPRTNLLTTVPVLLRDDCEVVADSKRSQARATGIDTGVCVQIFILLDCGQLASVSYLFCIWLLRWQSLE